MKKIKNHKKVAVEIFFSIFLGTTAFLFVYGVEAFNIFPLAFNHADYIMYQSSYYAFLESDWQYPVFNSNNFFVDKEINLYLFDYIPLYSILLKFINTVFNYQFENPFTVWVLINTLLTFFFSFKILTLNRKLNLYYGLVGAFCISTLPLAPHKIQYHGGEGSHWILIAGIYFYLQSKEKVEYLYIFSLFAALSLWIHFYLFTIVCGIWSAAVLENIIKNRNKKILLSIILFLIIFTLIFFLSFGSYQNFFDTLNNVRSSNFNPDWSSEFNSFFCGNSQNSFLYEILMCFEPYTNKNIESYVYLGLGVILFSFIILKDFNNTVAMIRNHKVLVFVSLVFLFFSFGNRIKIAHKQIFEYQFNSLHHFLIDIYRAYARFSFLIYYLFVIYFIYKFLDLSKNNRVYTILFIIFVSIQFQDLNHEYNANEFIKMKTNSPNIEIIDMSKSAINSKDERLFVYPPNNCIEDFDLHLFSKEFIKNGGSVHTFIMDSLRGGKGMQNCKDFMNIELNLITFSPHHFITNIDKESIPKEFINMYDCETSKSFYYDDDMKRIYYCLKSD